MHTVVVWTDNFGALDWICIKTLSECGKFYIIQSNVRSVSQGFPFRMNEDPRLIDAFNNGLLKILSAGIESKLAKKYRMDLGDCEWLSMVNHQQMDHSSLKIETLAGSFVAAAMGFGFCVIIVITEKLWHKYGFKG